MAVFDLTLYDVYYVKLNIGRKTITKSQALMGKIVLDGQPGAKQTRVVGWHGTTKSKFS
jgi:hypothetical protein